LLVGLVRTPVEKRDNAAIEAGINACEALFAMLDDALAQQPWLSGAEFGPVTLPSRPSSITSITSV
jgi:glutathione S-transferase